MNLYIHLSMTPTLDSMSFSKAIQITFFLLVSSTICAGQTTESIEKDSLSIQFERCQDSSSSFYDVITCLDDAIVAWDEELNKVYKELLAILNPEQKKELIEAQRKWIAFRDEELEFSYKLYDRPAKGWQYDKFYRELELTRQRVEKLRHYKEQATSFQE